MYGMIFELIWLKYNTFLMLELRNAGTHKEETLNLRKYTDSKSCGG